MMRAFLRGRRHLRTPALCRRCRTPCPGWTEHRTWQAARWRARLRRDGRRCAEGLSRRRSGSRCAAWASSDAVSLHRGQMHRRRKQWCALAAPRSSAATYSSPHPPLPLQGQGRRGHGRAGPGRPRHRAAGARPARPDGLPPLPASRQFRLGLERGLPARQVWPLAGRPADGLALFSDGLALGPASPGLAGARLPDPPTCPQGPCAPRAPAFRPPFSPPLPMHGRWQAPAVNLKSLDPAPHAVYDRRRAAH